MFRALHTVAATAPKQLSANALAGPSCETAEEVEDEEEHAVWGCSSRSVRKRFVWAVAWPALATAVAGMVVVVVVVMVPRLSW